MDSPGHRKDILDPELTRVGVGIVRDENGQFLVTEDFMEDYRTYDTAALAQQLIEGLNEAARRRPDRRAGGIRRALGHRARQLPLDDGLRQAEPEQGQGTHLAEDGCG